MNAPAPFCEECGRVGARLSGLHPGDAGIVRWTLYKCGHVTTEIVLDAAASGDEPELHPGASRMA
jgi:hypothetical protein